MQFDTHLLEKADFVRLKTLQLSYTLPKSILNATGLINVRKGYIVGRNLLTLPDYQSHNPESDSNNSRGHQQTTAHYYYAKQQTCKEAARRRSPYAMSRHMDSAE